LRGSEHQPLPLAVDQQGADVGGGHAPGVKLGLHTNRRFFRFRGGVASVSALLPAPSPAL
jgi:hypothetical protein